MRYTKSMYQWTLNKVRHPKAKWFLSFISFIESSVFPIPPDIILIPMIIANQSKAWFYATICTVSSVCGALLGYLIGAFFFNSVGTLILETYNLFEDFEKFKNYYDQHGALLVLGAGFTPFPYKLITIASGVFSLDIKLFILMSIISRGGRFFVLAILLWYFGPKIKNLIEKHFGKFTVLFFLSLVAGIIIIKFI